MESTRKIKTGLLLVALGFSTLLTSDGLSRLVVTEAMGQEQNVVVTAPAESPAVTPNDTLARSQDLLLRARRALMGRDTASATKFVNEAMALNAAYTDASDRPEYVLPLLNSYKEIEEAARVHGFTESVRRDLAKNYLNQAEALRRCRDYDNAEALVIEAKKLDIVLDAKTSQSGMDVNGVQQRIQDDRMAAQAMKAASNPVAPLENVSEGMRRQVSQVQQQLVQGRQLLAAGQMDQAEKLGRDLASLGIPENAFVGGDSPARLLGDIAVKRSGSSTDVNAGAIRQVQGTELLPSLGQSNGYLYVQEAEAALRAGNNEAALKNFREALRYVAEMDAQAVRHINESIEKLSAAPAAPEVKPEVAGTGINFDQAPQQIQSEISTFITKTHQVRNTNPDEALAMLEKLRDELAASSLESGVKGHFSYSVDMAINETNRFIAENGPMIQLDNRNKDVEEQVRLKREEELQIQNRLAEDTEKFNQLLEEGKYDEAIILAKKCQDYSDDSVVSIQMFHKARTAKQVAFNNNLKEEREAGWLQGMNDVESASVINVSDESPVNFGPLWDRVKNRTAIDTGATRSEADLEILNKLNMQITLPFDQPMPLATVMEFIQSSTDMNVLIDNAAMAEAGITSDMTVETKLSNITLKNYLKHILDPYNLTYVVGDEVLKITSKNKLNGKVKTVVYSVADLVCPIPNFNGVGTPWSMESSFNRAFNTVNTRGNSRSAATTIPGLSNNSPLGASTMLSPDIMAQIASAGGNSQFSTGNSDSATGGMSDPSELINLITSVVDPESWTEVGEPQYFNLAQSLIIRQTEENHEEICDLLEKIRSMLDLQIAVEVRFITISDEYFERIGVNFNVSFHSDAPASDDGGMMTPSGSGIYGLAVSDAAGDKPFTDNLNIDFSQNSYGLAIPQFGNYDPSVGAQMGFAILSDIESYFFMNAAESDRRSNLLQAPKVVMFNGQWASVEDSVQVPYVYTVIPVVGEFAVAQQPVVTVINEGQFMAVQAVASQDRRFVRMTVSPYFSEITQPDRTFKFEGSDTVSKDSTSASKGSDSTSSITDEREDTEAVEYVSTGTTIQQPVISQFTVTTTVKVPDGGTVLLGGIKRLNEGRNEGGVPILSKIPYLKRLFSNSAIGRETTSLMMLVTPRIIIQEEEEAFVFGTGNTN